MGHLEGAWPAGTSQTDPTASGGRGTSNVVITKTRAAGAAEGHFESLLANEETFSREISQLHTSSDLHLKVHVHSSPHVISHIPEAGASPRRARG